MALLNRPFPRFHDRVLEPSEVRGLADMRRELLASLAGTVVEVGTGTGLNLAHYPTAVERIVACEPQGDMAARLRTRAAGEPRDDLDRTAAELARVMRPGGTLALVEHVAADDGTTATLQRVVEPVWRVAARGCHLTRHPAAALEAAGFDTSELRAWTIPGSVGIARRALVGHAVRR